LLIYYLKSALMKAGSRTVLFLCFILLTLITRAQVNPLELDPVAEKTYNPYMGWRHIETGGLAEFKKNHPHEYLKELWYYSKSFYIKRNHFSTGNELNAGIITIDRFESSRKEFEESIVILPGYKDVLVLLPANKLIYKP